MAPPFDNRINVLGSYMPEIYMAFELIWVTCANMLSDLSHWFVHTLILSRNPEEQFKIPDKYDEIFVSIQIPQGNVRFITNNNNGDVTVTSDVINDVMEATHFLERCWAVCGVNQDETVRLFYKKFSHSRKLSTSACCVIFTGQKTDFKTFFSNLGHNMTAKPLDGLLT